MKKLPKLGQRVRLLVPRPDYSCGHLTNDGRIYVPVGTEGMVGETNVPSVCGKNGQARYFCCVDFPHEIKLEDCKGKAAEHWDKKCKYRVAAYPEEIELVEDK